MRHVHQLRHNIPQHTELPIEKTPLPGAMMPLSFEKRMVPPPSDKKPHHKPDMVDKADHHHTIPI